MTHLVSWAVLLVASGPLLAHPMTESAEMAFAEPVSAEDRGVGPLEDVSFSDQSPPLQDGLRYSALMSGESNRDGARAPGSFPRGPLRKEVLLNPFSRVLGIRKQLRKRAGNSECFWKYCV